MNEKEVPTYPIVDWIPTHPTVDMEKYPKAGDPNPLVRIGVVGSNGGKVKWISAGGGKGGDLPLGNDPNVLIPRFGWVRDGVLWAVALNRLQTRVDIYFIDVQSGKSQRVLTRDHRRLDQLAVMLNCCRRVTASSGRAGATATTTFTSTSSISRIRWQPKPSRWRN